MSHGKEMHLKIKSRIVLILFLSHNSFANNCSQKVYQELLQDPVTTNQPVYISCSQEMKETDIVKKKIIIQGRESSNITIDCNGGAIGLRESDNRPSQQIEIRSKVRKINKKLVWEPVSDITIKNCKVYGQIRIWGMGKNGQGKYLLEPSRKDNFSEVVQSNAPRRITLDNLTMNSFGATAIYISPGTHRVTIKNSTFNGYSKAPTIYFDTATYANSVDNNHFNIKQQRRELIAIDSSYENNITNNTFKSISKGGIFLYRNCGEGGVIRHSTPSRNIIVNNIFYNQESSKPVIYIGSRQKTAGKSFCDKDIGYPFGSSIDNHDYACENVVQSNQFFYFKNSNKIRNRENSCENFIIK